MLYDIRCGLRRAMQSPSFFQLQSFCLVCGSLSVAFSFPFVCHVSLVLGRRILCSSGVFWASASIPMLLAFFLSHQVLSCFLLQSFLHCFTRGCSWCVFLQMFAILCAKPSLQSALATSLSGILSWPKSVSNGLSTGVPQKLLDHACGQPCLAKCRLF